jgi:hypothetical protein
MKRYTIAALKGPTLIVLDNTPNSSARGYYQDLIEDDSLFIKKLPNTATNADWLAKLPYPEKVICELDDYRDLPKLHPELFI